MRQRRTGYSHSIPEDKGPAAVEVPPLIRKPPRPRPRPRAVPRVLPRFSLARSSSLSARIFRCSSALRARSASLRLMGCGLNLMAVDPALEEEAAAGVFGRDDARLAVSGAFAAAAAAAGADSGAGVEATVSGAGVEATVSGGDWDAIVMGAWLAVVASGCDGVAELGACESGATAPPLPRPRPRPRPPLATRGGIVLFGLCAGEGGQGRQEGVGDGSV